MKVESKESKRINDEHNKERSSVLFIHALACFFQAHSRAQLVGFLEDARLGALARPAGRPRGGAPMPCRGAVW